MKNLLIYIVSFQIFRTSRSAIKKECVAPQIEEKKYELEGKIEDYSKIFEFPSNFNDIRRNHNYIMQQNTEDVFFTALKLQKTLKFELSFLQQTQEI